MTPKQIELLRELIRREVEVILSSHEPGADGYYGSPSPELIKEAQRAAEDLLEGFLRGI